MSRPTISQIANHNESAGFFYFARKSLKFFKQKRSDFKVIAKGNRTFVLAPLIGNIASFGEYDSVTGNVRPVSLPGYVEKTFTNVYAYLEGLEA